MEPDIAFAILGDLIELADFRPAALAAESHDEVTPDDGGEDDADDLDLEELMLSVEVDREVDGRWIAGQRPNMHQEKCRAYGGSA